MALPTYYDYNPTSPWHIVNEIHTIDANGLIRLVYIPLKGNAGSGTNVQISGYTETTSNVLAATEFKIDYQDAAAYRTAMGVVQFNTARAGQSVTVSSYYGVSKVVWADELNEIKAHMENNTMHPTSGDDTWIGNKTINDSIVTAYNNTGTLTTLFSFIGKMIKTITGKSSWFTAPSISLEGLWTQVWTREIILFCVPSGYISPIIPLARNGSLPTICVYPSALPLESTPVKLYQGNTNTITADISAAITAVTLTAARNFTAQTYMVVDGEVMLVTAVGGETLTGSNSLSGVALTVTRGQQGTVAVSHLAGTIVFFEIFSTNIVNKTPSIIGSLSIQGTARDMFVYGVGGNGLVAISTTIVQEWRNR